MSEETLNVEKLCSGDQPSIMVAGMLLAHALKKDKVAIFSTDVLGHVVLLPPTVLPNALDIRIRDKDLDELTSDEAIRLMIVEGREDKEIVDYLMGRSSREANREG